MNWKARFKCPHLLAPAKARLNKMLEDCQFLGAAKNAKYRKDFIERVEKAGDFIEDVDGFIYYYPTVNGGHLNSSQLRMIADELDHRNEAWQKEIEKYFEDHPPF